MPKLYCLLCGKTSDKIWDALHAMSQAYGYWCPPCAEKLSKAGLVNLELGRLYSNTEEGPKRITSPERETRKYEIMEEGIEYSNPPTDLVEVLMQRDKITREEAEASVMVAKEDLLDIDFKTLDITEFMADHFGLEPDYFIDLI